MGSKNFLFRHLRLTVGLLLILASSGFILSYRLYNSLDTNNRRLTTKIQAASRENKSSKDRLAKINQNLEADIKAIETTYDQAVGAYEKLLDLKAVSKKTQDFDKTFANILTLLSQRNYSSAEADLKTFTTQIVEEKNKVIASFVIPQNVPTQNTPPSSGYSRQVVATDLGEFLVDIF